MNGYEVYKTYMALKFHFEDGKYDFFKYNGQVKSSELVYKARKDRWHYEKVAKAYGDDSTQFLLANLMKDNKFWIGNAMKEESKNTYLQWRKVHDRMEYTFETDLKELETICTEVELDDLYLIFFVRKNETKHPFVLRAMFASHITLETFCVLNQIFDFDAKWKSLTDTDPIARNMLLKVKQYTPFVRVTNMEPYKKFLNNFIKNVEENRLEYIM